MKALHLILIMLSWGASVVAQPDPNYLAHGLYHPDIIQVLPVVGANPGGPKWADSYSVGDKCYCIPKPVYADGINDYPVETPKGWMTVREACDLIGYGPGPSSRPIYNDIQCGNGPPNSVGDEHHCPGRVDIGKNGCGQIGPTWDFGTTSTLMVGPIQTFFKDVGARNEDKKGLYSSGKMWTWGNSTNVQKTKNDKWFQTHRSGTNFGYLLDGFTPYEEYRVSLGFSEVYYKNCQTGKRVQEVLIQGKIVLKNFDVYAVAGCATAHLERFDVFANKDGKIRIALTGIEENAMLSTIKIEPRGTLSPLPPRASPPPPPPPPSPSTSGAKTIDAGTKSEDTSLTTGKTWTYAIPKSVPIKKTSDPDKFRTHRSAPKLLYAIPNLTPRAKYELSLGFAEIWRPNCKDGKRIFNIKVNGQTMQTNVDVYKEAGCESALIKTYSVNADSKGRLVVEIVATVENAMVSLIEYTPEVSKSREQIYIDVGAVGGEDMSLLKGTTKRYGKTSTPSSVSTQFRTHRWGQDFTYTLAGFTKDKEYNLRLGFAEIYSGACENGKRVFAVKINNKEVESNLDVYKAAGGCKKSIIRTYKVKPNSQGKFEIQFKAKQNNAMVSFIEIKQ